MKKYRQREIKRDDYGDGMQRDSKRIRSEEVKEARYSEVWMPETMRGNGLYHSCLLAKKE